jgi:hypothetical protein
MSSQFLLNHSQFLENERLHATAETWGRMERLHELKKETHLMEMAKRKWDFDIETLRSKRPCLGPADETPSSSSPPHLSHPSQMPQLAPFMSAAPSFQPMVPVPSVQPVAPFVQPVASASVAAVVSKVKKPRVYKVVVHSGDFASKVISTDFKMNGTPMGLKSIVAKRLVTSFFTTEDGKAVMSKWAAETSSTPSDKAGRDQRMAHALATYKTVAPQLILQLEAVSTHFDSTCDAVGIPQSLRTTLNKKSEPVSAVQKEIYTASRSSLKEVFAGYFSTNYTVMDTAALAVQTDDILGSDAHMALPKDYQKLSLPLVVDTHAQAPSSAPPSFPLPPPTPPMQVATAAAGGGSSSGRGEDQPQQQQPTKNANVTPSPSPLNAEGKTPFSDSDESSEDSSSSEEEEEDNVGPYPPF